MNNNKNNENNIMTDIKINDDDTFDNDNKGESLDDAFDDPKTTSSSKRKPRTMLILAFVIVTGIVLLSAGVVVGTMTRNKKKDTSSKSNSTTSTDKSMNMMSCNMAEMKPMNEMSMMAPAEMDMTDDMMTMESMELSCMDEGEKTAVYTKMKSEKRTMDSGDTETVWVGAMMDGDQMGFATIVSSTDGMAGSFTTDTATYSLIEGPDGTMQMRMSLWSMLPDEGETEDDNSSGSSSNTTNDMMEMEVADIPMVMNGTIQSELIDIGSTELEDVTGGGRFLRESRQLQTTSTIRVLLLVTNRAMCENAGLRAGCTATSSVRSAFTRRVPILVSQTNNAMQAVNVRAQIQVAGTIFLRAPYDGVPTSETISLIQTSSTVAGWRRSYRADLVAMITGEGGGVCGRARLGNFASATVLDCLGGFTFTHELGHNMRALHNRESSGSTHSYGHGYRLNGVFRTVMSSSRGCSNCSRIPFFSANGFTYRGRAIGTPTADNARRLRGTAPVTSRWVS